MARRRLGSFFKRLKRRQLSRKDWAVLAGAALVLWIGIELLLLPNCSYLRNSNPARTALMQLREEARQDTGTPYRIQYAWMPLNRISRNLARAVIAGEDFSFFSHHGLDWSEIGSVLTDFFTRLKFPRGASTITQQLAKNLFLSPSKNPLRKLKEVILTYRLEDALTKSRILELYLNVIEWGDGIFGAEAAARHYFSISAAELSLDQAAFLAAIIPGPLDRYNPGKNPKRVVERKRLLLKRISKVQLAYTS